jgi:alpha-glucoside transport system substrate-binding protein
MKMSRRTKAVAILASSALATVGLAACGGSEAAEGGPVTIWMSLDETTVAGLTKTITAKAEEAGIEVKIERVDAIDQLVKTRIQAGDPPDIALVPQPGVVKSIVDLGAAYPLDDVLDLETLEGSMVPGTLDAGRVDGELYGLMTSMNVKSLPSTRRRRSRPRATRSPRRSTSSLPLLTRSGKTGELRGA